MRPLNLLLAGSLLTSLLQSNKKTRYGFFFFTAGLLLTILLPLVSTGQDTLWTQKDRQALIENYERTKKEVNNETKNLSAGQWNFKESADAWSIAEV